MTTFITADLHFNHKGIIGLCNRPFKTVKEMDTFLLEKLNSAVEENDRLIVIGDFCFGNPKPYIDSIQCKNIELIIGNHDTNPSTDQGFSSVEIYREEIFNIGKGNHNHNKLFVMFHYPILEWNRWYNNSYHLHGHVHGTLSGKNGMEQGQYRLDVGVDCHGFEPLPISKIATLFDHVERQKKPKPVPWPQ